VQWLNIQITDLHSEQFLGSDPTDRATWLALLGYCASQENGGTIDNACSWSDRMCQQVLGVTKDELDHPTQLWTRENDCVTVWAYPVDQERVLQAKREGGKAGGIKSGAARKPKPEPKAKPAAKDEGVLEGVLEGILEGVPEGKGKERKGKKGKHGEFENVTLKQVEFDKITEANGKYWVDAAIVILDNYMESHGKTYKSCYATMTKGGWVYKELQKNPPAKPFKNMRNDVCV